MCAKRFFSAVLIAFFLPITASNAVNNIPTLQLPPIAAISKIEVFLTPNGMTTIRPLREEDLPGWACTFTSSGNSQEVEAIFSIISDNIKVSDAETNYYLMNAIYLHLKSGEKIKFLLSHSLYSGNLVLGNLISEIDNEKMSIRASGGLLKNLRIWARNIAEQKNFSKSCVSY